MPLKYFYIHICFYFLNNFIVCGLIIAVPLIIKTKYFRKPIIITLFLQLRLRAMKFDASLIFLPVTMGVLLLRNIT